MSGDPTVFRLRTEDVAWREFDGESILLDLRTSMYLAANPAATVLWRKLAEGTTREGLVEALVEEFGIPAATAAVDVAAFLADCRARNLVSEHEG
jgi:hypothetical protein